MESKREERSGEIGPGSGSVPSDVQSASTDPDQLDQSTIQNFAESRRGTTSENQSQEEAEDEDENLLESLLDHLIQNHGQISNYQTKEGLQDQEQSITGPEIIEISSDGSMDDIHVTINALQGSNGETSSDEVYIVEHPGDDEDVDDDENNNDDEDYEASVNIVANVHESSLNNLEVEDFDHVIIFPWWKELASEEKVEKSTADVIDVRYKNFKQFDMVEDYTDHHYFKQDFQVDKPSKEWVQKIQHEWKLLQENLPENTIFVRVYGERMDLLRAVIIGSPGTPYHDGLFFFDFFFPSTYPDEPPLVHYISHGLSPNPNLDADGTVCISLLGTWSDHACERWNPKESTILQVLVSIQALVLNSEPYFDEAPFDDLKNTYLGFEGSARYNKKVFLISCKTMLHSIRNPPKNFEDFVAGHFRKRGKDILIACRAYIDGMKVGKEIGVNGPEADRASTSKPSRFKVKLGKLFQELLREFAEKGADCRFFLSKGQSEVSASTVDADTTSRIGV